MIENVSVCKLLLIPTLLDYSYLSCKKYVLFVPSFIKILLPVFPHPNINKYCFEEPKHIVTIMLVCPRCGKSNIRNSKSLTIHLTRYCTGPTLPSNAFTNSTLTSRSPDGQHPLSMATTALQQARHFNAPEVNIALPPINTLYAMPSISQLTSTSNIRNADSDDADFSQCNDASDCSPVVGVGNILIEKFGRTSIERQIHHNAPTLPLSGTLGDKVVYAE